MLTGMASDSINRSKERSAVVMIRLSRERRDELKSIAREHGLSVQAYLEMVAFGDPNIEERKPGRPKNHPELFSMTG